MWQEYTFEIINRINIIMQGNQNPLFKQKKHTFSVLLKLYFNY